MNYLDILVFVIIALFVGIGIHKGLVLTVFRLASSVLALILSVMLRPLVAGILKTTSVYTSVQKSVGEHFLNASSIKAKLAMAVGDRISDGVNGVVEKPMANAPIDNSAVINSVEAPSFIKGWLLDLVKNQTFVNVDAIVAYMNELVSSFIIDLIAIVSLFVIFRLTIVILRMIFKKVLSFPVLKQADKLGGAVFGLSEALIVIFVIFGFVTTFQLFGKFEDFLVDINNSLFAKYLYDNNVIVMWLAS